MQATRVRSLCVLHQEFGLIRLHDFLTALPRPDSQLPCLNWASSMLPQPRSPSRSRSRENCLTHITAVMRRAGRVGLVGRGSLRQSTNALTIKITYERYWADADQYFNWLNRFNMRLCAIDRRRAPQRTVSLVSSCSHRIAASRSFQDSLCLVPISKLVCK